MIYYYSATGNSAWLAGQLSRDTGLELQSIVDLRRQGFPTQKIGKTETLGLVFPVYSWTYPKIVGEFLQSLEVADGAYVFALADCGDSAGAALKRLNKKLPLNAGFILNMPNTYIAMFDTDSPEVEQVKIAAAREALPEIAEQINRRKNIPYPKTGFFSTLAGYIVPPFFRLITKDKRFRSDERCISCGLCAKVCPVDNIDLTGSPARPRWKGHCTHCMACIHHCPTRSIQYGRATEKRGRYVCKIKN